MRDSLAARTGSTWGCHGITLDSYPSGQTCLMGYVESGEVSFIVELTPSNFGTATWSPGDEPVQMAHDAWNIEAGVWIAKDRHGNEPAVELPLHRCEKPEEACAALADASSLLSDLALSREPTLDAWSTD